MEGYRTDEEQIEHLKKWWNENGKAVIGGLIIGLAAVYGWRGWQTHLIEQGKAASDIYQNMTEEVRQNKKDSAREYANNLLTDYSSTTYATFAAFMLAKLDAENKNPASAINHLQWILENENEQALSHIARLRIARLLLAQNKPLQSLEILNVGNPGKFISSYEELRGDSYLMQGNTEAAKKSYEQALINQKTSANEQSIIQMKLDDMGH